MAVRSDKPIIGIVGAGTMGTGIAQVAAGAGYPVVLYDSNEVALTKANQSLRKLMHRLVEKGRMTQSEADNLLGNISIRDSITSLKDAEFIIEAIIEDLDIKREVFRTLEGFVSSDCILATNTSSLSVASIAGVCKHPERVLGVHFFNPPGLMRLVEIVPAIQTAPKCVAKATGFIKIWGKLPVVARDTPGFIVNRIARPFYSEALRILEEGIANVATIDWAMKEVGGFRMGPFELMDYIGNDVNYAVTESVWAACYYEPRYKPAFTQRRLVDAGYLGRKSGRGYYDYSEGAKAPAVDSSPATGEMISDRIITMLINEAADALYWNIAERDDIDLAMTAGVNYPKGLLKWADEKGIDQIVEAMDAMFAHYHEERYRCSPLLRAKAAMGTSFYEE